MRRGPQGNVDRNARIVRMVEGGQTYTDTAAAMGVTRNVVAGVCSRAGCVVGPENRADRMRNSPLMGKRSAKGEARRMAGLRAYWRRWRENRA
jgi:hypothetical protein